MEELDLIAFRESAAKMTAEQLHAELKRLTLITAEHIERMAVIAHELERRGEDVPVLRTGIGQYLAAVYSKRLVPEAVIALAGNLAALRAIAGMPPATQRELLTRGSVWVRTMDGSVEVKLALLTRADLARVIDPLTGRVLELSEQKAPVPRVSPHAERNKRVILYLNEQEYTALQRHSSNRKIPAATLCIQSLRDDGLLK